MPDTANQEVKDAKAPVWKKVLIWSSAILGILTLIGIAIFMAVKRQGPVAAYKDIINKAKLASSNADIDAKVKIAEAEAAETEVINKLKEIKAIKDEEERARRLAELL